MEKKCEKTAWVLSWRTQILRMLHMSICVYNKILPLSEHYLGCGCRRLPDPVCQASGSSKGLCNPSPAETGCEGHHPWPSHPDPLAPTYCKDRKGESCTVTPVFIHVTPVWSSSDIQTNRGMLCLIYKFKTECPPHYLVINTFSLVKPCLGRSSFRARPKSASFR